VIPSSQVKEEQSLRELSLPPDALTRLCFFAVPLELHAFYREKVFPLVKESGFVPITADDVVAPGDTIFPKVDALIDRALLMIVDASTEATRSEFRFAVQRFQPQRLLLVSSSLAASTLEFEKFEVIGRPDVESEDIEGFLERIGVWLREQAALLRPLLLAEPLRLLESNETRAAAVSAISLLESVLRRRVDLPRASSPKAMSLRELVSLASSQGLLGENSIADIQDWLKVRNDIVHSAKSISKEKAEAIVNGVSQVVQHSF
jgi:hypothetical protein